MSNLAVVEKHRDYRIADIGLAEWIQQALTDSELRKSAEAINRGIVENEIDWRICTSRMQHVYDGLMAEGAR